MRQFEVNVTTYYWERVSRALSTKREHKLQEVIQSSGMPVKLASWGDDLRLCRSTWR